MANIIVTLAFGKYREDYELPWEEALGKLYPRVMTILKEAGVQFPKGCQAIVFEREGKGLLDEHATLMDYGVCTGALLEIEDRRKYYGM